MIYLEISRIADDFEVIIGQSRMSHVPKKRHDAFIRVGIFARLCYHARIITSALNELSYGVSISCNRRHAFILAFFGEARNCQRCIVFSSMRQLRRH